MLAGRRRVDVFANFAAVACRHAISTSPRQVSTQVGDRPSAAGVDALGNAPLVLAPIDASLQLVALLALVVASQGNAATKIVTRARGRRRAAVGDPHRGSQDETAEPSAPTVSAPLHTGDIGTRGPE